MKKLKQEHRRVYQKNLRHLTYLIRKFYQTPKLRPKRKIANRSISYRVLELTRNLFTDNNEAELSYTTNDGSDFDVDDPNPKPKKRRSKLIQTKSKVLNRNFKKVLAKKLMEKKKTGKQMYHQVEVTKNQGSS